MARINLLGGTYLARSVTADAQRCVNLYPEKNPEDASAPFTNQLTPGTIFKATAPGNGGFRGLYTATNGNLYAVVGQSVYFIDSAFTFHLLGVLNANLTTPVGMQDNGLVLIIVDGTSTGYAVNLQPGGGTGQPTSGQLINAGTGANGGSPLSGTITPGSGAASGVYSNVIMTGGTGQGSTASITVGNPIASIANN